MQLKTVKTAADLPFKGVELVKVDGAIAEVIVGGKLRISAGQYSGIKVCVETLGEQATRYRLKGDLDGFGSVTEYHEHDIDARNRKDELEATGAKVSKATVSVLIDDNGKVLSETVADQRVDDDLPF